MNSANGSRFQSSANEEASRGNDDFVQQSRMSAQQQVEQENLVLTDMSHALERLQGISETINTQLVTQGQSAHTAHSRPRMASSSVLALTHASLLAVCFSVQ